MTIVIVRLGEVGLTVFTVLPMASAPVADSAPVTARLVPAVHIPEAPPAAVRKVIISASKYACLGKLALVPPNNCNRAPVPEDCKSCPPVVGATAVSAARVVAPVADSVLNAPVDGVVAPIAVEFRPVEVKVPDAAPPSALKINVELCIFIGAYADVVRL